MNIASAIKAARKLGNFLATLYPPVGAAGVRIEAWILARPLIAKWRGSRRGKALLDLPVLALAALPRAFALLAAIVARASILGTAIVLRPVLERHGLPDLELLYAFTLLALVARITEQLDDAATLSVVA